MSELDHALALLPEPLCAGVAAHWQAFMQAAQQAGLTPPTDAAVIEPLVRVWAASDFVARACIREPFLLSELLDSGDLKANYGPGRYSARLVQALEGVEDEQALNERLRCFRRREMIRIAWRDLAGLAPFGEIVKDLSDLADALIEAALQRLHDWQSPRFGLPRDGEGNPQQLVVFGMGKLGGQELNFSSDIDLVFAFPHRGETDGKRCISNEEFFRRLGQQLIKVLQQPTGEGFVFRVDMRLRPFGDAGPLVMPFNAMEDYYQHHGRDWERYAMIKARVVAGDRKGGDQLLCRLQPFVYRRYLDYGAFEALRTMKTMIAKEVERKGLQRNIKLGPGGIREIEFIGQAFQLIYGGREPALRQRRLLPVLDYLGESERLSVVAVKSLKEAYLFLRQVENRLQAWEDQQTHNLPEDESAKLRLAYSMGFADWAAFREALLRHVRAVTTQFERVFAAPRIEKTNSGETLSELAALWHATLDEKTALDSLTGQGYDEADKALESLQHLRQSFTNRALSKQGRERLDKLMPLVLEAVGKVPHPSVTLERVTRLLEAVARRSVYLALLVERPEALGQLVKLCSASLWIADYLARYPLLLDELLDPATLYAPLDRAQLGQELKREMARVSADDAEQILDTLRHFKHTNVLRVAAADVSGAMPLMIVSDHLTEIAEVLLRKVLELAWADLLPRFGRPRCVVEGETLEPGLAIVAYGKLGGIELGYGSDLDLVFLHDSGGEEQYTEGPRQIDNPSFFAKLAQRIIHLLTAHTRAGILYDVDTRLRPSGRSGLLVGSIDAFAEYQRHQAWTWEHQALVRARVVAGPSSLAEGFNAVRREVLSRQRDTALLRQEVTEMRERMRSELGSSKPGYFDLKQDRGGIADIEFMVQYAILAHVYRYPELLTYTDNIRQLDGLERVGIFSPADATRLRDAYRTLRRQAHLLKLQEQSSLIADQELQDCRKSVMRIWQTVMEGEPQ